MAGFRSSNMGLDREVSLREKLFFIVAMVGALIFFIDSVWTPGSKQVRASQEEVKGLLSQVDAMGRLVEATRTQLMKTKEAAPQSVTVDPYVTRVLSRQVADMTEEINSTVDLLGSREVAGRAEILKVEIESRQEQNAYVAVPVTVELLARYTGIRDYLKTLEQIDRPFVVKSFRMVRDEKEAQMLHVEISAELYIPKRAGG